MTDLNSDIEEVIKNLKLSEKKSLNNIYPVSYTHLTLPTSDLV